MSDSKFKLPKLGSGAKNPLARILLTIIAVVVMVPYEAAKTLCDKAYSGFAGAFRAVLGFAFGITGGIAAGHYVGWTLQAPTVLWLLSGLAGFIAVTFYLWPIAWLVLVNPAWRLADAIWDGIREFARKHFKGLTQGFINLITSVFPLSGKLWGVINKTGRDSWLDNVLIGVSYCTAVAGSGYLGWSIYKGLGAYLAASWGFPLIAAAIAAGFVGVVVFAMASGVLAQLLKYGEVAFVAVGTGFAAVYALSGITGTVVAGFGLSPVYNWAAYAVEYLVYMAYAFPLANVVLSDGFKWFIEKVKPLIEEVYDGEEKKYRQFFHGVVNLATALSVGSLTLLVVGPMLALPVWGAWLLASAVALLSYIIVFKVIDMDGGNIILSLLASAAAGWFSFSAYSGAGWIFGIYGAIAAGIAAAALNFLLVFPLTYILFRFLTNRLLSSWLSEPMTKAHGEVYEGFKRAMKEVGHCYEYGYRDKSDAQKAYRELFLHLVNLATAVGAYFGCLTAAGALGLPTWATWVVTALGVLVSYTLVGKLILKAGTELVGVVAGLTGAVYAGSMVHAAGVATWLSAAVGLAAFALVFFIVFPLAYVIVRVIGQPVLTGWLKPALESVYNWFWARVVQLWELYLVIYRSIRDFIKPYWQRLVATWRTVWKSVRETWDSIRGKRA